MKPGITKICTHCRSFSKRTNREGGTCMAGLRGSGLGRIRRLAFLVGPFLAGDICRTSNIKGMTPRAIILACRAGREHTGERLLIGLQIMKKQCQVGKTGPALTFHYADVDGRERLRRRYEDTYILANLDSFEWVKTACGEEVVELARTRGAKLARADGKILYGARIKFRGWQDDSPSPSGSVVSLIPGKYEQGNTFPHFTWGGKATKSDFLGRFELLCYLQA